MQMQLLSSKSQVPLVDWPLAYFLFLIQDIALDSYAARSSLRTYVASIRWLIFFVDAAFQKEAALKTKL